MSIDVKRLRAFAAQLRAAQKETPDVVLVVDSDGHGVTLLDLEQLLAVYEAARRVRWAAHVLQQAEEMPRSRPFDGGVWQAAVQGAQFGLDGAIDALAAAVDAAEGAEGR